MIVLPGTTDPEAALAKIGLMCRGIAIPDSVRDRIVASSGGGPLTLADYATTSGITLRLRGGIWVNAPFADHNPNFVGATPWTLGWAPDGFHVTDGHARIPAEPVPVPRYHDETDSRGEPYTSMAITHSDRVRISPVEGCAIVCRFCDLPFRYRYRTKSVDALVESVGRALRDDRLPARHVLISGGTPRPADYPYLLETYRRTVAAFPGVPVDVMMVPMPGLLDPAELHDIGVSGLSINIEIHDAEIARRVMPAKARLGADAYLGFIERAAVIFGPGRVRSLLLVGIEPIESTLAGVEEIARRGADPVLSPFRPDPGTPMHDSPPPGEDVLVEAWCRSVEIARRHGVRMGPRCIPCQHNTLTFPDGSADYAAT